MLAARSVAVVGASARPGSFGERLALEALRSPGVDRVALVHPAYDEVQGHPCVPSLGDLAEPVDLVMLGVPDAQVPEQVALAEAVGAGGAVVYGSAHGLGEAIRAAAGGMPLCGAGCMGLVNPGHGLRALGYLEREPLVPGGITLVTHSGSMFSALLRTHRRLEFNLAVSSGQELVTTAGDYLTWALGQPETRVVGLFLETIRDAPRLRSALATAAARDVPVVALTVGASAGGRALVTAHSGAVAGADAAWEALFATYGVHRVRDVEELVDTLELFAVGRRLVRPAGGIATIHDSGAERVLLADVASDEGVRFARFGVDTEAALVRLLDEGLPPTNPLDVWGRGTDTESLVGGCLRAVAADADVDVVALAVDLVEEYDGDESYPRAARAAAAATDKPLVVLSQVPASVDQGVARGLRGDGIPVLEGARSGLRALGHLRAHAVRRPVPGVAGRPLGDAGRRRAAKAAAAVGASPWLSATETLGLLAAFGIPVVQTQPAEDVEGVLAAAAAVGYPVVVKTDQPGIEHRARVGGVFLGLADAGSVRAAYATLVAACGPRVVVQPELAADAELALGVVADPQVGPILLLGTGGAQVEEAGDRVLTLPPVDEAVAAALVEDWAARRWPASESRPSGLGGVPPVLVALGDLALSLGDRLAALDVNPLLLTPTGPVAVDALVQPS